MHSRLHETLVFLGSPFPLSGRFFMDNGAPISLPESPKAGFRGLLWGVYFRFFSMFFLVFLQGSREGPLRVLPLQNVAPASKIRGSARKGSKNEVFFKWLLKAKKTSKMRPGDANEAVKKHEKSCPKSLFFLGFLPFLF